MGIATDRRRFLKNTLYGAAGVVLSPTILSDVRAQEAPATQPRIEITDLGAGLHVLHILPAADATLASGLGTNVVVLRDPAGGRLMVDGGLAVHSAALLTAVAALPGSGPVHTLFNTNWYVHCTGSNLALGAAGTKIISTVYTRQWMSRENFIEWQNRSYERMPAAGLPNDYFYILQPNNPKVAELRIGDERVEYGFLNSAFTNGDLYVYFREANVLVTGDTMTVGNYPLSCYVTGGWMQKMRDAAHYMLAITNADTRIVARSGSVQTRADLQTQFDFLDTMCDTLVTHIRAGRNPQTILAQSSVQQFLAPFNARWGNPNQFIYNAYWGMMGNAREWLPAPT